MKRISAILLSIVTILVVFTENLNANSEKASKEECVAKSNEAIKMIQEIGFEATLEKMNDKNGPFMWKGTFAFCIDDQEAKIMTYPGQPYFVGHRIKRWYDFIGNQPFITLLERAATEGRGWVTYTNKRYLGKEASEEEIFFIKVPNENAIVCCCPEPGGPPAPNIVQFAPGTY